jgi:hypothetical protein
MTKPRDVLEPKAKRKPGPTAFLKAAKAAGYGKVIVEPNGRMIFTNGPADEPTVSEQDAAEQEWLDRAKQRP